VVRVYEVADLLTANVPNYPAKKLCDMGDGRSLFPEKLEKIDEALLGLSGSFPGSVSGCMNPDKNDAIIDTITRVISPNIWEEVGGPSSIKSFGDMLVISAPEKTHTELRSLLNQIREHLASRKTFVVETHWLWLNEEQLHNLVPNDSGSVSEEAWDKHQKLLAKEDSDLQPGYHATITCLNGQTSSAVAGKQRRFIISLIPVVGDNGMPSSTTSAISPNAGYTSGRSVGYQPQSTTIQEGAALQVRPILCGKGQVLLDIHGRLVEVETSDEDESSSAEKSPAPAAEGGSDIRDIKKAVDRPVVNTSRTDTSLMLPLGSRTLIGGITGATRPERDEPSLYLFAKVTVKDMPKDNQKNK
jgi:hypothetical protein